MSESLPEGMKSEIRKLILEIIDSALWYPEPGHPDRQFAVEFFDEFRARIDQLRAEADAD